MSNTPRPNEKRRAIDTLTPSGDRNVIANSCTEKQLPGTPPLSESFPSAIQSFSKNTGPSNDRPSAIPIFRKNQQMNGQAGTKSGRNFAAKAARAGAAGLNIVSSARPPWKGANGRPTILSPIADSQNGQLTHSAPIRLSDERSGTRYLAYRNGKISPIEPYQRDRSPSPKFSELDQEELRPPVPLKTRKTSAPSRTVSPVSSAPSVDVGEGLQVKDIDRLSLSEEIRRHMESPAHGQYPGPLDNNNTSESAAPVSRFSWTTRATESEVPSTPQTRRHSSDIWTSSPPKGSLDRPQPVSHFSWTTRGTNDQAQETPTLPQSFDLGNSPSPLQTVREHTQVPSSGFRGTSQGSKGTPQPAAPNETNENAATLVHCSSPPTSIMSRRRPLPGPNSSVHCVKRKPVASELDSPSPNGPSKQLPLAPPELESVDIITALEAQLDELGNRRGNLQKVIHSLTALQPQNPVVQDLAKKRADRKRADHFERELAEVRSKEHELGLRLHRAWKRRDQEGPTGLWVRRVTG